MRLNTNQDFSPPEQRMVEADFDHFSKRSATPSTPGSRNSVLVSTPNGGDTYPLQFLLNSASAYACP
ncbi:MAG: hypothetical protein KAX47_05990, partial [Zoogloea sp.]|nr:hypothetical protein [Zoogloea sp.]